LLRSRRDRRDEGCFAAEGPDLLAAGLDADLEIERVLVAEDAPRSVSDLADRARRGDFLVDVLARGVLERCSDAKTPQGCAFVARHASTTLDELPATSFVLVVDAIQDPGNLGALVRVAEGCGADALIVTGESADPFGPKALRASTGSVFRIPVCEVDHAIEAIEHLARRGLTTYATSSHGGTDFATIAWAPDVALVLGNEGAGLDPAAQAACNELVCIPMAGSLESLNVSVAGGILATAVRRGLRSPEVGHSPSTMNEGN
jgi:RNA methyltransferase, TrmH family